MSLRIRLVVVLVALVAIALAVIEPVTYITTRQSLISKVDSQLINSEHAVVQEFKYEAHIPGVPQPANGTLAQGTYAAFYSLDGQLLEDPTAPNFANPYAVGSRAAPKLPADFIGQIEHSSTQSVQGTYAGSKGIRSFRVLGTVLGPESGLPGTLLVVALPLSGVQSTLAHVLLLEILVGVLVLMALAGGSWFLVRLSLRPLEQMANTASEIAAGDLTARIEDTDERTEVGQLGAVLNTMLAKIERAFREKEASEEQLRRFVADASHELRTPLTSIRGYAELFRSGLADRPEDLAAALRRIESESARMGGLVDDLLLLARLDQGRPLSRQPVDLTELAADAVRDASVVDPSREITLQASEPCVVNGEEERLRQVLGNLIANALAYSPPGSPVEVQVQAAEEAGAATTPAGAAGSASGPSVTPPRAARLAVVDHGSGVPADHLVHIFDRFWRADPSRVRAGGGTGLGLSIVAAVVGAYGGRVSVEETPGGGATFVVELPAGSEDPVTGSSAVMNGGAVDLPGWGSDIEADAGPSEVTEVEAAPH